MNALYITNCIKRHILCIDICDDKGKVKRIEKIDFRKIKIMNNTPG